MTDPKNPLGLTRDQIALLRWYCDESAGECDLLSSVAHDAIALLARHGLLGGDDLIGHDATPEGQRYLARIDAKESAPAQPPTGALDRLAGYEAGLLAAIDLAEDEVRQQRELAREALSKLREYRARQWSAAGVAERLRGKLAAHKIGRP